MHITSAIPQPTMSLTRLLNFAHTLLLDHPSPPPHDARKKDGGDEMERFVRGGFQMPLHYPRYGRSDYEKMEEWQLDLLLRQYGLNFKGGLDEKRKFAMGAFLWPDQY